MNNLKELSIKDKISIFEDTANNLPQTSFEETGMKVKHYFSDGIYARELFIPKGIGLTGHIHKYSQLNIMSKGKLKVLIDNDFVIVEAPFTIVSPPGTKRIALALEDTIWTTIHATTETDLNVIEKYFIAHNENEYLEFLKEQEKQLSLFGQQKCSA